MALVTTIMTGPSLNLINRLFNKKQKTAPDEIRQLSKFKVLVAFANPEKGRVLLRLANSFVKKLGDNAIITVLHLTPNKDLSQAQTDVYEKESFVPIIDEAKILNQKITSLFKVSNKIMSDIPEVANKGDFDLLLIGIGQSIYEGSLLGKILGFTTRIIDPERLMHSVKSKDRWFERLPFEESTRVVLSKSEVPVGILLNKNLKKTEKVFIPFFDTRDAFLMRYAQKLISNSEAQITILDATGSIKDSELKETVRAIEQNAPNHIHLLREQGPENLMLQDQDLMIISLESWKKLLESQYEWLIKTPSVLIIYEPALIQPV